jgi:alkylhydroperoxidase family enzyme
VTAGKRRLNYAEPPAATAAEITALRGRILNLHRMLAHNPDALTAFMLMSRHVRDDASLAPKLRELAIITIATVLGNHYELTHHAPIAGRLGVTPAQIEALPDWTRSDLFDPLESAVVRYARELTEERHAGDEVMAAILERLSPGEAVDLALTVGWYHLCHVVIDSFGIELES